MVKAINIFFNHVFVYQKIPKISPGAYIFQQPFLRGLFLEGLTKGMLKKCIKSSLAANVSKDIH